MSCKCKSGDKSGDKSVCLGILPKRDKMNVGIRKKNGIYSAYFKVGVQCFHVGGGDKELANYFSKMLLRCFLPYFDIEIDECE